MILNTISKSHHCTSRARATCTRMPALQHRSLAPGRCIVSVVIHHEHPPVDFAVVASVKVSVEHPKSHIHAQETGPAWADVDEQREKCESGFEAEGRRCRADSANCPDISGPLCVQCWDSNALLARQNALLQRDLADARRLLARKFTVKQEQNAALETVL